MTARQQLLRHARNSARLARIAQQSRDPSRLCAAIAVRLAALIAAGYQAERTAPGSFSLAVCCAGAVADMLPVPPSGLCFLVSSGNARPERN